MSRGHTWPPCCPRSAPCSSGNHHREYCMWPFYKEVLKMQLLPYGAWCSENTGVSIDISIDFDEIGPPPDCLRSVISSPLRVHFLCEIMGPEKQLKMAEWKLRRCGVTPCWGSHLVQSAQATPPWWCQCLFYSKPSTMPRWTRLPSISSSALSSLSLSWSVLPQPTPAFRHPFREIQKEEVL